LPLDHDVRVEELLEHREAADLDFLAGAFLACDEIGAHLLDRAAHPRDLVGRKHVLAHQKAVSIVLLALARGEPARHAALFATTTIRLYSHSSRAASARLTRRIGAREMRRGSRGGFMSSVATMVPAAQRAERLFYLSMALAIAASVLLGFARSVFLRA